MNSMSESRSDATRNSVTQNCEIAPRDLEIWKRRIIYASMVALLAKLFLAWFSSGTQDVLTYKVFSNDILQGGGPLRGGWYLYHRPYMISLAFNYSPAMLYFTWFVRFLSDTIHLPFNFCLRLPSILADIGTTIVLWNWLKIRCNLAQNQPFATNFPHITPLSLLFYALSPVAILISGFHGNTDSILIFFVLLSVWLFERGAPIWMVGVAFGMSLNFKVASLIFLPLFLLNLKGFRPRIEYSISVIATFVLCGMPYLAQDPDFILRRIFGYSGQYGGWGISLLLRIVAEATGIETPNYFFLRFGKIALIAALLCSAIWLNSLKRKPDLLWQCGFIALIFFVFTPSFGNQYLAWLAPLIVVFGASSSVIFSASAGLYLALNYGLIWRLMALNLPAPPPIYAAMLDIKIIAWFLIALILYFEIKKLVRTSRRDFSSPRANEMSSP